jgi:predicted nucleotidyltransferase component of viral defense system
MNMQLIRSEDIIHKTQMLRLLTEIADNNLLSQNIYFKGGTCASMLGYLDRFSIDLDFDLRKDTDKKEVIKEIMKVFNILDLKIANENTNNLFWILKYDNKRLGRNTLKLSIVDLFIKENQYQPKFLPEIDRTLICQTIETMFANKLVAPVDRYNKYKTIAGRDIYDIHYFFLNGYSFRNEVIEERTKIPVNKYLLKLIEFIKEKVTDKILSEDLNTLLPYEEFNKIRKVLKKEVLVFLENYTV